jgi:hypothetical protein
MNGPEPLEWLAVRIALGVVGLIVVAVLGAWKVHESRHPRPTRLEQTVACLERRDLAPIVPAGDPMSSTARAGSLRVTVEGSEVIVSLAKSADEAARIERGYHAVGGELQGRLERRGRSVFLWQGIATITQQQAMYDCQF